MSSILYVVATPIGNLSDISARALVTLRSVQFIAAEDTRVTAQLLHHYDIHTPLLALHEHNELQRAPQLLQRISQGESGALVTDAGTPTISDPGHQILQQALAAGIKVVPIPGANAVITALSVAGLPADRFVFEGFLPARTGERERHLQQLLNETRTLVFYEAPHRIVASVRSMIAVFGEQRLAVLAKELTKHYETVLRAPLAQLLAWLQADVVRQKGEFVIVLSGCEAIQPAQHAQAEQILSVLLEKLSAKDAAALTAKITGVRKNYLYQLAIKGQQAE